MVRLIFWFAVLVAITFGITWLADSPGEISIVVRGYRIETQSIGLAALAIGVLFVTLWLVWSIFKWIIGRPSAFGGFFTRRRERKGRQALSTGLVAIGAGDKLSAQKAATTAARLLPNDPLAQLLSAQSAQQQGDTARVKQVYSDMTKSPDTKLMGLRGLFDQARQEKNIEAARDIAKQALAENPGVSWASNAMLVSQAADKDWPAVLVLLDNQLKAKIIDKDTATRKKAVVLTAQALEVEDKDVEAAIDLGTKAHKLDPKLVPAAVIAARANITTGALRKATKILEKTWSLAPHPDIAEVYAHARAGDSVTDRLARVKTLLKVHHGGPEGAIALATAAMEADDWKTAREALNAHIHDQPSVRICTLMAQIEAGEHGDKGRAREWLARAVHARRDPVWTTQGYISPQWLPISPITGELGAFEWKVPLQGIAFTESQQQAATEALVLTNQEDAPVIEPDDAAEDAEVITVVSQDVEDAGKDDIGDDPQAAAEPAPVEEPAAQAAKEPTEEPAKPQPVTTEPVEDNQADSIHHPPDDPGPKKPSDNKSGESWFG